MNEERKVAKNYRKRARVILEAMLTHTKALAGPDNWREPSDERMERFVDNFHHIANWMADGARRLGFPVAYYPGPLTESELKAIEDRLVKRSVTIVRRDNAE